jgi:CheY-like chemotaxis protein
MTVVSTMRVLVADDDPVSRRIMQSDLAKWGYEVRTASNGLEAARVLESPDAPNLAILDWMMPGIDGIEIVRKMRQTVHEVPSYLILLTARTDKEDLVEGLEAGADDFLRKPYDPGELRARLNVGVRLIELQRRLSERVREAQAALARVKKLSGLLPICSYCKKIRRDGSYWEQLESFISEHSEAHFSHGVCPSCYEKVVRTMFEDSDQTAAVNETR